MRIILFGKSKRRTRTTSHIVGAFKDAGHTVLWLNPSKIRRRQKEAADSWTLNRIAEFDPHLIFIYSMDIPLDVLEKLESRNILKVLYYEDMSMELSSALIERGKRVDFLLATNKGMLGEYRKAGIVNPTYFPGACDRHDHRRRSPVRRVWKSDVAFIGKARPNESRVRLAQELDNICRVKVYGKNWEDFGMKATLKTVTPRRYGLICGGAKIILGADITSEVEGYWSNRLWLTLGCGGFFLTAYVRGMEDFFENEKHLVWYHDEQECIRLARTYLEKPDERRRIAANGFELVQKQHTFHHFAERVMALTSQGGPGNAAGGANESE